MVAQLRILLTVALLFSSVSFAESLLIKNAKVHTLGSQGTLDNASILIVDGKVVKVAVDIAETESMNVIDAAGREVTPGIMNASTNLGLVEIGAVSSTVDSYSSEKDYSAAFSIAEIINPNSSLFAHNRINGLTRAMVKPSSSKALFSGAGSLIQLAKGDVPVVLTDNAAYLKYGEAAASIAGGTRALALFQIKMVFEDLSAYEKDAEEFKASSSLKIQEIEALMPMFKGEVPLVVSVNRVNDIRAILALQKKYSLKMILSGAKEAWKIADDIAAAKVAVMTNTYSNLPGSFESIANRIDAATILHAAGVELIFTNYANHNAYRLRGIAGNAVTYGLPWDVALAAITSTPAKWFGVADSYGKLEAGMDADLVIWDGDPLEVTTSADQVFIQGGIVNMVSRQTRLRDRYMNKGDMPAAYSK